MGCGPRTSASERLRSMLLLLRFIPRLPLFSPRVDFRAGRGAGRGCPVASPVGVPGSGGPVRAAPEISRAVVTQ
eukprot:4337178-Pyramimonas_sp.AAC.1